MIALRFAVVLGLLVGSWAILVPIREQMWCESPEAEAAALAAQDYLNTQHTHVYKYALNRIEDAKAIRKPMGDDAIYLLELDLLETNCHLMDPTPVANCSVRPKALTAVEGDCDFVLSKEAGVLTVIAFKCKTEESTEDICLGCPVLLPLNHTGALDFVSASLLAFNNQTANTTFVLSEVGRLAQQLVSLGPIFVTEYAIVEANCTNGVCVAMTDNLAQRGFCTARGSGLGASVDCKLFPNPLVPVVAAQPPIVVAGAPVNKYHFTHHKLVPLHDPSFTGLLSVESAESAEVVPIVPVAAAAPPDAAAASPAAAEPVVKIFPVPIVKRQIPDSPPISPLPAGPAVPIVPVQLCPGRIRHF